MFLQQVGDIQFFRLFWILSLYSVVFYRLWWICRKFFLAKCHQTFETLIWEETSNQILRCTFWFQFFCLEEIPHYHHKDEQYFTKVLSIKLIKGSCVYLGKSLVGYFPVYHSKACIIAKPSIYKVVITFESVDEILWCDHSNESYWAVLSCGTVYNAVQGGSNFWVYGWNP